jgi:glucose/arabinose dehydrogenase
MKLFTMNKLYSVLQKYIYLLLISSPIISEAQSKIESTNRFQKEESFYEIKTVPIPENIALEVGGMAFLPNDKLAVSTRQGEVWIISNPYMKNGLMPRYKLYAQGLHEALGLNYIKGDLFLTQRAELTRLRDLDNDGEADEYKTVYSWPLSGNYHEYAYGPILDKDSNMMVNLNVAWIGRGASIAKWHGWMLKIKEDGKMEPFLTGLRSPAGLNTNNNGDLFYAENQGDWVGSGSITHAEKGDFMGNTAGLVWAAEPGSPVKLRTEDIPDTHEPKYEVAKRVPGLKTPSVWFPHTILGISTSGILSYD